MNDHKRPPHPNDPPEKPEGTLRSPVRPTPPPTDGGQKGRPSNLSWPGRKDSFEADDALLAGATSPVSALNVLRGKMELVASEYAAGKINRAQFNAIYGRYSEQRAIIERLMERNPDSGAWKQVMGSSGHTGFLRQHFEAQVLYYLIYRHREITPMMMGGKHTPTAEQIVPVLRKLWAMPEWPKNGLARRAMSENHWLVLAVGEFAVTLVMFLLEPSIVQANLVRDLHQDFERANFSALKRGTTRLDRMVFPQRALVEEY